MVYSCSVPFCKSGYSSLRRNQKKVSVFQFPADPDRRAAWTRAIHRSNFVPTKYSRVCSLHFKEEDFVSERCDKNPRRQSGRLKKKSLKGDAIPSVFPDYPSYLQHTSTVRRSERATSTSRLDNENLELMMTIDSFEEDDTIDSLQALKTKFLSTGTCSGFVLSGETFEDKLVFLKFSSDLPPKIVKSVVVSQDLSFVAYEESKIISPRFFECSMSCSTQILRFSDFQNLLVYVNNHHSEHAPLLEAIEILSSYVENCDVSSDRVKKIMFLCEQLLLLCNLPGPHHKFSTSLLTTAILWKAHSTSCYKAILAENVLTLPSLRTLRRIAHNFSHVENDTNKYLRLRVEKLNVYERCVTLLFDEVYVYQNIEYENGKFVGLSVNDQMPATSLLCFMIKSLASKYSDIVAMIPVHGLNVECLRTHCLKVLQTVTHVGFKVVALCSDNHPVNRSFYRSLSENINSPCDNPCDPSVKLHLLIDPTHTIKNVYNNFQKRISFRFPTGLPFSHANFNHIKELYDLESTMSVRMAHKLSRIVLSPTNIQRASAKLSFSLFCDSTVAALQYHVSHDHPEWGDTSRFLSYFNDLVKICNIRSKNIGQRTRDDLKLPFYSVSDDRLTRLYDYANFFRNWRNSKKQGLSVETFTAVENLCHVLCNLVVTLLTDFGFSFVLTGYLQSDPLESRFGRYRQMSGGNFFISVKQIIESERKIRLSTILHHSGISLDRINTSDDTSDAVEPSDTSFPIDNLPTVQLTESELQVIYYIAGYCAKRVQSNLKCTECLKFFISCDSSIPQIDNPNDFFTSINRGGLKAPANEIFVVCCTAYEIFCRIKKSCKFDDFLRLDCPRSVFVSTVLEYLKENDLCVVSCKYSHHPQPAFCKAIAVFFNCLARNFLRSSASASTVRDVQKIRKLRSSRR